MDTWTMVPFTHGGLGGAITVRAGVFLLNCGSVLVQREMECEPVVVKEWKDLLSGKVAASCHEGLSLWCQSRCRESVAAYVARDGRTTSCRANCWSNSPRRASLRPTAASSSAKRACSGFNAVRLPPLA
jgi:hypothetical protein